MIRLLPKPSLFAFFAALAALAATLSHGVPARAQVNVEIIAVTGEYAHGGGGGQFSLFDRPDLNDSGDFAFRASMNPGFGGVTESNKTGIWRKRPTSKLHKIARADDYAPAFKPFGPQPEVTTSRFATFSDPLLGPDGRISFLSHLKLPSESSFIGAHNNEIIWSMKELSAGMLDVAQEKGSKAPMVRTDTDSGQQSTLDASGKRTWFHVLRPPAVMPDGAVIFTASLQLNGLHGKSGIWFFRKPPGEDPTLINPHFILIEDADPIPGAPPGASFREFSALHLSPSDKATFHAFLDVGTGAVPEESDEGIWTKQVGGPLLAVAVAGSADTATPGHLWAELGKPVTNQANDIAFRATLVGTDPSVPPLHREGIWTASGAPPSPVALAGQQAPGFPSGTVFETFDDPSLAPDGSLAFSTSLRDSTGAASSLSRAIYQKSATAAGLTLLAKSGDLAPGTGGSRFLAFGTPLVNGARQVAFSAELDPSSSSPGGHGLWATSPSGTLHLVAATGSSVALPGGSSRTLQWLEATKMNSGGQTALRLHFEDGTEAVAIASFADPPHQTFAGWAESLIADPAQRSAAADPDGDGIPNLLEFAFGGHPLVPDPSRNPEAIPGTDPSTGNPTLELVYHELADPGPLTYSLEASDNLFIWSQVESAEVGRTLQGDGTYRVRVREKFPPPGTGDRFLRIAVSTP